MGIKTKDQEGRPVGHHRQSDPRTIASVVSASANLMMIYMEFRALNIAANNYHRAGAVEGQ